MENIRKHKNISSTPASHIGIQAFLALLIMILLPLTISVATLVKNITSKPETTEPIKAVVKEAPKNKVTLTRFLAAAVFGVGDENIIVNEEEGVEIIVLPYGGQVEGGGNLEGTGNIDIDRWAGAPPTSDGSTLEIRKPSRLSNAVYLSNGGSANAGGNISSGGTIPAGGFID